MKNHGMNRMLAALAAAVLCLTALVSCAGAESGTMSFTEWKDQLLNAQNCLFKQHKNGLGLGLENCPVYTAPYQNAYRFANNRQACDPDKNIFEAGKTENGWLLVRYDPGNGIIRTGYIAPKQANKFRSQMSTKGFVFLSAVAAAPMDVTDDPVQDHKVFKTIETGESFYIVAKYVYHDADWWYVECTKDGKPARGFIRRKTAAFLPGNEVEDNLNQVPVTLETLGSPSVSPMGTEKVGEIVINGAKGDERKWVHKAAVSDNSPVTSVYPTMRYPCYAVQTGNNGKPWYYIFVEDASKWGWVTSEVATFE